MGYSADKWQMNVMFENLDTRKEEQATVFDGSVIDDIAILCIYITTFAALCCERAR